MVNNESPINGAAVLKDVYALAESLYLMSGGTVPEGCSFSRSLGEVAEHCYKCAAVIFLNEVARALPED